MPLDVRCWKLSVHPHGRWEAPDAVQRSEVWVFHCLAPPPAVEVLLGLLAQSGSTWPLSASVGFVPRPWCPAVRSRWSGPWRTGVVEWSTWFKAAPMCFCGSGFLPGGLADAQVHHPSETDGGSGWGTLRGFYEAAVG